MANNNNDLPIRTYQKQFAQLIQTVYGVQGVFAPTFGQLQALDGVQDNATAFSLKTNDVPVVVGEYSTDADVAFGTGTANSSRFGEMKEIKYADVDVPYDFTWSIHEGLDRFTVNNDLNAAVADRLNLQAQAKTRLFNKKEGQFLADSATDIGLDATDVNKLFETAVEKYTDLEVVVPIRAYVTAAVYNAIIDLANVTSGKGSAVDIDSNGMVSFRGIALTKVPSQYMAEQAVIFTPDNIGRAFTGISTARTIESTAFDGQELQGAGKAGQFISDDNKKAIFKAVAKKA